MAGGAGASRGRARGRRGGGGSRGGRIPPPSPPPESSSESDGHLLDLSGFRFGVPVLLGASFDRLLLPQRFANMLDRQEPSEVNLRVHGGETGLWSVKVTYDRLGQMFLSSGWRKFSLHHDILPGNYLTFQYDGHGTLTVGVYDATGCRRKYHGDSDSDE